MIVLSLLWNCGPMCEAFDPSRTRSRGLGFLHSPQICTSHRGPDSQYTSTAFWGWNSRADGFLAGSSFSFLFWRPDAWRAAVKQLLHRRQYITVLFCPQSKASGEKQRALAAGLQCAGFACHSLTLTALTVIAIHSKYYQQNKKTKSNGNMSMLETPWAITE